MTEPESLLAMCERHVIEGEARVTRQKQMIVKLELEANSEAVIRGQEILRAFQESLVLSYAHLERERAKPPH